MKMEQLEKLNESILDETVIDELPADMEHATTFQVEINTGEDLMKITQICVEIWRQISLKIAKLRDRHYCYSCILRDVVLNYNCKTQC